MVSLRGFSLILLIKHENMKRYLICTQIRAVERFSKKKLILATQGKGGKGNGGDVG